MNNVPCEVIQDLLPLYCDGVCNETSLELIRAHLHGCDRCREELRLMQLPVNFEQDTVEIDAAKAASVFWKKKKRSVLRKGMGFMLVLLLLMGVLLIGCFLGQHYHKSCADGDLDGLRNMLSATNGDVPLGQVEMSIQKGNYLAIACSDSEGRWHVGVFMPDNVFSHRWVCIGSLGNVRPGKLASWNCKTEDTDTVLVCFGVELPETISGYTFTNSGVTYICPVEDSTIFDFFLMPDVYDAHTRLEPIWKSEEA